MRPIAGTNANNDDRGEGHNESRTPLQLCTGVFQGRLLAGDGQPGTRQCTAGGGPGSIAAGRAGECSCPSLREKDARCKRTTQQEAGKPRKKRRRRNTGKTHGPKKTAKQNKQPLGQDEQKNHTATRPKKISKKTQKILEVDVQAGVRVHARVCRQETQEAIKTPGPPGTAGVFIASAPETKHVEKKKEQDKQTRILSSFIKRNSRRDDATYSRRGERRRGERKRPARTS